MVRLKSKITPCVGGFRIKHTLQSDSQTLAMWKNLEQIRRQVEESAQVVRAQVAQGAKEFAQTAIEGVRDLKAQHDDDNEGHDDDGTTG